MKKSDPNLFHVDQYNNRLNADTYEQTLGPEIINQIKKVD